MDSTRCIRLLSIATAAMGWVTFWSVPISFATEPGEEETAPLHRTDRDEIFPAPKMGAVAEACINAKNQYHKNRVPKDLFTAAECLEKSGMVASASAAYEDYLYAVEQVGDDVRAGEKKRMQLAAARRIALEKRVPWITLQLPANAPPNTLVTRPGIAPNASAPVMLNRPMPLDPGEYVVQTRVPGAAPANHEFLAQEGARQTLVLTVDSNGTSRLTKEQRDEVIRAEMRPTQVIKPKLEMPVNRPLDQVNPSVSVRRTLAYAFGIGGVGMLAAGVTTFAVMYAQKDPIAQNCLSSHLKLCNATGVAAKETAKTMGLISTIALPSGLVALATGITLHATGPSPQLTAPLGWQMNVSVLPGNASVQWTASW